MRAPTLFVRLLRAGGVALALEILWFAMGGRVDGVFSWLRRLGEGAFNLLLAPVAAVALAIAAPWIAARFRWPSRTSPPEGARSSGRRRSRSPSWRSSRPGCTSSCGRRSVHLRRTWRTAP
jgi:hypothetical protein